MNKHKLIGLGAFIVVFATGCAFTQKLPSLTLGGAANKDAVLGAKCNKDGASVTAPLVNLTVPFPSVKSEE